jgi:hypothetical protein
VNVPLSIDNDDIVVTATSSDNTTLRAKVEDSLDLPKILREVYHKDTMFSKIMAHPEVHTKFGIRDRLIWTKNQLSPDIVCIPQNIFHGRRRMIKIIIDHQTKQLGTTAN